MLCFPQYTNFEGVASLFFMNLYLYFFVLCCCCCFFKLEFDLLMITQKVVIISLRIDYLMNQKQINYLNMTGFEWKMGSFFSDRIFVEKRLEIFLF